jgi:hypothetical protein
MSEHRVHFPGTAEEARRAVNAAAAGWGASWTEDDAGGELVLPIIASLRRGVLRGRVAIEPRADGAEVVLTEGDRVLELNRGAVAVLVIGAVAGVLLALWPFFPKLLVAAPLAAVLAFLTWFMVVSRLRMSGPEEFLGEVLAAARESK